MRPRKRKKCVWHVMKRDGKERERERGGETLYIGDSVTRLGDLLHFGQLFKACGNNYFGQIAHIIRQFFVKVSKSFNILVKSFLCNFLRHLATFYWSHWLEWISVFTWGAGGGGERESEWWLCLRERERSEKKQEEHPSHFTDSFFLSLPPFVPVQVSLMLINFFFLHLCSLLLWRRRPNAFSVNV